MSDQIKKQVPIKLRLHPRNKHRTSYNFEILCDSTPELSKHVIINKHKVESINFHDPNAVKMLNKALLEYFYNTINWDIPEGYLCPPIPGRADYIHYIADLLSNSNSDVIPHGEQVRCLDIGVGANCVYPIIGIEEYAWSFVGSEIDKTAIDSIENLMAPNPQLKKNLEVRYQPDPENTLNGIIKKDELFDIVICNPPFHNSSEQANKAALRKVRNLKDRNIKVPELNFAGQSNELWCRGGEVRFIKNLILQSEEHASSCLWFSSILSRKDNLQRVMRALKRAEVSEIKIIPMGQGNKVSRIVAWTFLNSSQRKDWASDRWR